MRRLPVYILADVSGSMSGAPIQALNTGIQTMIDELLDDPRAMESAYISLITFSGNAQQVVPLTDLMNFQAPELKSTGSTSLWAALRTASEAAKTEIVWRTTEEEKADYKPLFFLITDGHATDSQGDALQVFNSVRWGIKVCCGAGNSVDTEILKSISDVVLQIETDANSIAEYFKWVTASIATVSKSQVSEVAPGGDAMEQLAPPPGTLIIV